MNSVHLQVEDKRPREVLYQYDQRKINNKISNIKIEGAGFPNSYNLYSWIRLSQFRVLHGKPFPNLLKTCWSDLTVI